jgi:hypothetical protein
MLRSSACVHPSVVADAGGLLVLSGLLEGAVPDVEEILVLDATNLLVAEYLSLRHEGAPRRAQVEYGAVTRVVQEWFPVRGLAMDAALRASADGDLDGHASLELAESLGVPLVTKNRDLDSAVVTVLHC